MAKSSGITSTLSIDDGAGALQVVSNDVFSWDISTPRGSFDVTGLDKSAIERLLGLADATLTLTGGFNTAATVGIHTVLKTMSSTNTVRTVTLVINSTPSATLTMEMICTEYTLANPADRNLTASATLVLANGTVPTWS